MASTNKTPQLGLNQWAAGDPVLREDFNGDNGKIDAAVGALQAHKTVYGAYIGSTKYGTILKIDVGFKPQAVLVARNGYFYPALGALIFRDHEINKPNDVLFQMTETGFQVYAAQSSALPDLTGPGIYYYIAIS